MVNKLIITYILIAVSTFGQVYNTRQVINNNAARSVSEATVVSMFWPFYWSILIWEK